MAVNLLYLVIPMFMKCYINYFRQLCSLSSVLHCLTEATQNSGKMQCQYGKVQRYGKCPISRRCQHDFQGPPAYVDHKIFSTAPFFNFFFLKAHFGEVTHQTPHASQETLPVPFFPLPFLLLRPTIKKDNKLNHKLCSL